MFRYVLFLGRDISCVAPISQMDTLSGLFGFAMSGGSGLFKSCYSGAFSYGYGSSESGSTGNVTFETPQALCFVFVNYSAGSRNDSVSFSGVITPGSSCCIGMGLNTVISSGNAQQTTATYDTELAPVAFNVIGFSNDGLTLSMSNSSISQARCSYISFGL